VFAAQQRLDTTWLPCVSIFCAVPGSTHHWAAQIALYALMYTTTLGNVTQKNVFDHLLPLHLVIYWGYPVEQFLPVLIHRLWCVDLVSAQENCSKEGEVGKGTTSCATAREY